MTSAAQTAAPFIAKSSEGFPSCWWDAPQFASPLEVEMNKSPAAFGTRLSLQHPGGRGDQIVLDVVPSGDQVPLTRLKPAGCYDNCMDGADGVTTLMVCHVPRKYSQALFAFELDATGFSGRYDFVYLPLKTGCLSAKGFAFVNFTLAEDAQKFQCLFHNMRLRHFSAEKPLAVRPADVQGFNANAEKYFNEPAKYSVPPLFLIPLPVHLSRKDILEQSGQIMKRPEGPERRAAKACRAICDRWSCNSCGETVLPSQNFCAHCGGDLGAAAFMQSL